MIKRTLVQGGDVFLAPVMHDFYWVWIVNKVCTILNDTGLIGLFFIKEEAFLLILLRLLLKIFFFSFLIGIYVSSHHQLIKLKRLNELLNVF